MDDNKAVAYIELAAGVAQLAAALTPVLVDLGRWIGARRVAKINKQLEEIARKKAVSDELDGRRDAYMALCAENKIAKAQELYPDIDDMVNPGERLAS